MIETHLISKKIFSNNTEAFSLSASQAFGEKVGEKILYMPEEAYFLFEKKKLVILNKKQEKLTKQELLKQFQKQDKNFLNKYLVFKDMKEKGYVLKTGLKFGTEYRVYEKQNYQKGKHSTWLMHIHHETEKLNMKDFTSKNRVAHSTKKALIIAIVDNEGDVSYYETNWKKM
jgi:tRNA-intron endonuclease